MPPRPGSCGRGLLFCSAGQGEDTRGQGECCGSGPDPTPWPASQLSQEHPFTLPMVGLSLMEVPAVTAVRVDRGHCNPASAFPWAEGNLAKASPSSVGSY